MTAALKKAIAKHGYSKLQLTWKKHGHRGLCTFSGIGKKTGHDLEDLFRYNDATIHPICSHFDEKERLSTLLCEKGRNEFRNAKFTNTFTASLSDKTISSFLKCADTMSSWSAHDQIIKALSKKLLEKCGKCGNKTMNETMPVVFSIDKSHLLDDPWTTLKSLCGLKSSDFKMVDNLAQSNNWWDRASVKRAKICILIRVDYQIQNNGDTYLQTCTLDTLLYEDKIPLEVKETAKQQLFQSGALVSHAEQLFTTHEYASAELGCAKFINNNAHIEQLAPESETSELIKNIFDTFKFEPTDEQSQCISDFCKFKMSIITGPGGTGKSEMLKTIIQLAINYEMNVVVLVPTHQVRKLITKLVSEDIKKLISIETYAHFIHGNRHTSLTLPNSVYIIEEASMADSLSLWRIFQRANSDTRIILCGDASQCRPVSAGAPFFDIWRSKKVPTTELTHVFRAESQEVADFSALYRHNGNRYWSLNPSKSTYALKNIDSRHVEPYLVHVDQDAKHVVEDVDKALRTALQDLKNSGINDHELIIVTLTNDDCKRFHIIRRNVMRNNNDTAPYAIGDIVMFNSITEYYSTYDRGTVEKVDGNHIFVRYEPVEEEQSALQEEILSALSRTDDELITHNDNILPRKNADNTWTIRVNSSNIKPAGAVTVHASQGAQWPYVIAVFYNDFLSKADKVYTATSRTKKKLIIVGTQTVWNNHARPTNNNPRTTLLHFELEKPIDNDSPTTQEIEVGRNSRGKIPKAIRDQVWRTYNGEVYNSICYVCNRNIDIANFHCGHVIAHSCGGGTEIDNLRPICMSCNCSMGVRNLDEFKVAMQSKLCFE
jgi:5-methylcytosine-specific restriction endonuclease McrA